MSWVISLVLAGLMIAPGAGTNLTINNNGNNFVNGNTPQIVSLDETERFEQTYPLNANGRVSVSNVNGSITVEAWDRNEVRLEAVKTADTKERLADVQIRIDARQDYFSVETDYGSWKRNDGVWKNRNSGKLEVQYRLQVPRGAVLDEVETVNGSVTISNMTNSTKASAVNGNVKATNLRGTARISTVNGTTEADFDSVSNTGQISLDTVNGKVLLTVPSDINATVKADSLNGQIINDFGLPVRKGEYVGRDLYGKIGSGELRVRLNSVNGDLIIKRKQDGKSPNTVVNLLTQKNKSDEDDDDDDQDNDNESRVKVNNDKLNKDIAKSVKQAQKVSEQSEREVKRELEKIKPELDKLKPELEKVNVEAMKEAAKVINSEEVRAQMREARRQQRTLARLDEIGLVIPSVVKKTETFKVKGVPKVSIDAKDCPVTVKGWDKPEVQYFITKVSRQPQQLLNLKVLNSESEVNIKVNEETTPNAEGADGVVLGDLNTLRIEVYVPKKSNLRILSDREVRLENVSGDIQVEGGDESINVRDVDGKLRVSTADGGIRIIGFRGELDSRSGNGLMNLEGDFQKINAQTVDGTIVLTLGDGVNANLESNSKEIETDGIALVPASDKKDISVWKIGEGSNSSTYRLYTTSAGQIIVRCAETLRAGF